MSGFAKSIIIIGNILILLVNCYNHWNSTTLNLFISELLITSESVEYQTILSNMEEKTPDQGATGETASSTGNMEVGMQTSLSEEEQEAHLLKDYDNTLRDVE